MKNLYRGVLFCLCFAGCTSDGDEISSDPLSGMIGGKAWTFEAGLTNAFLSDGEDDFFASLYAEDFDGCDSGEPFGTDHISASIPKTPGSYSFSLSQNLTFVIAGEETENLVTLDGKMEVTSVDAGIVRGGVTASYDSDNFVDGQFAVEICE